MEEIYLSWEESVHRAYERYHVVLERCGSDGWAEHESGRDEVFEVISDSIDLLNKVRRANTEIKNKGSSLYDRLWDSWERYR